MVLRRLVQALSLLLLLSLSVGGATAYAHKNHQQERIENQQQERIEAAQSVGASRGLPASTPGAMQERMEEHIEAMEEQRPKSFSGRLINWLGRTHPFAVHFPIALFPVALVALLLARRRGETVELIRALIIVAGAASVIAGILGWFTGGFTLAERDAVQLWHRWLGTALAAIGGLLAYVAARRRASIDSGIMVAALGLVTLTLLVQGWLGAALVHGMDHMNW